MAASVSCSWLTLPSQMRKLSLTSSSSSLSISNSASLSFSRNLSHPLFSQGTFFTHPISNGVSPFSLVFATKRERFDFGEGDGEGDGEGEGELDNDIKTDELAQFEFATIKFATNNFSDANKLGQGGFGIVYKV